MPRRKVLAPNNPINSNVDTVPVSLSGDSQCEHRPSGREELRDYAIKCYPPKPDNGVMPQSPMEPERSPSGVSALDFERKMRRRLASGGGQGGRISLDFSQIQKETIHS